MNPKKPTHNLKHDEATTRLIKIDHRTENMQDSLGWLVVASAPQLSAQLLAAFGTSKRRAQVYLALDGRRSVNEVADHLGMKPQNVSIELTILKKKRLIDVTEGPDGGVRYSRKHQFDAIVGVSDNLMELFNVDADGKALPTKVKKKKT